MGNIFESTMEENIDNSSEVFTEAVFPNSLPYNHLVMRQVALPSGTPIGKGNLCFLYSHSLDDSIEMMNNTVNFLNKKYYKYYYYNYFYQGKIYNKRYRIREFEERKEYYKKVEDSIGFIRPRIKLVNTAKDNRNMFYELFRFLDIFESICNKMQPNRYIDLYWNFMKQVLSIDIPGYTDRFVLINIEKFSLSKNLRENLKNPLFMLFYTLMRRFDLIKDFNMDFFFYAGKKVLKINPSTCDEKSFSLIRTEMNKMMRGIVNNVEEITDNDTISKEEIKTTVTSNITNIIDTNDSIEIKSKDELVKYNKVSPIEKEIEQKVDSKVENISKDTPVIDTKQDTEKVIGDVEKDIKKELDSDRELIEKIYYQNKSNTVNKKSEASTARDKLLRENQKNINVGNMKISDLEKIKTNSIPIIEKDVSKSVTTTNENMKKIRFANLDKEYNDKIMKKDITEAILSLNDKSIPMFVRDIQIKDTSDELNYKDTYTILLEDANRKRHTIKVDIPKFIDDRFLYIGGNKKVIKHQSFYYPVVKIASNMVQIVTNYSKMTIERVENKSTSSVERLKKAVSTSEQLDSFFTMGNVYAKNKHYVTTLEYDELAKTFYSFKNKNTLIMFDQTKVDEYMEKNNIPKKDGMMYIGKDNGDDVYIDINTQKTTKDEFIIDIILNNLPSDLLKEFDSIKAPKKLMFAKVRIMKQFVTVGMLLGLWNGLTPLLKRMNVQYRLVDKAPSVLEPGEEILKFSDCIMVYKEDIPTSLILNGFRSFNTANYSILEFDEKLPYLDYIKKVYGKAVIENALMNFYEFAVDPITLEILKDLNLPTDIIGLFIHACNLLADSQFTTEISQDLCRIRCNEIIPAILYERLSKNYVLYRNFNGRKKFTIPQDAVIKEILALKTVEDYSTLNPFLELNQIHAVSTKGFRGVNLDEAYTMERRGYDPSMTGIIAPVTSPDGSCGVSRYLTIEPQITNLRGYTTNNFNNLDKMHDTNLFSPTELAVPLSVTFDDPNRLGHSVKQSTHTIPVKNSSPVLISNGFDEVARFHLTSNFVVNAEEDGEIIDYDEESKIMIAKYKSGKCRAIDLSPNIVKNGGGGFFLSNILTTKYKVGDKFKKDDVLAYHKDFFKNDQFNNCRLNIGTMTKVAIMSTYNTYEDATFITHKLSEDCASEMCFCKGAVVGKNSNVFYMVHKGQEISVGEPLIQFDTNFEDETINALLANLAKDEKDSILEGARNEIKSKYSGVIEDIKIYSTIDLDEMSPSLRKIVSKYYRDINHKKEFLEKYEPESKGSIVKCGMLVNETSHKVEPNKFGVIKGEYVDDGVLIEFYIKHSEPLEVGSKIAKIKFGDLKLV